MGSQTQLEHATLTSLIASFYVHSHPPRRNLDGPPDAPELIYMLAGNEAGRLDLYLYNIRENTYVPLTHMSQHVSVTDIVFSPKHEVRQSTKSVLVSIELR